ncbi:CRISPR-associated helicase Cas3' [Paenibacillus sp. SC116]|uniref:CRISPR-associated helicase Cas3' n=1 Tax=Paenibacillus sp. SC116 TaxID=2968986 RepID=UPI00215AA6D8|nr:CRISPR-associated helicase Cas3' [Paenibacillus sp. SC116]MCR8844104.1 CRISPR-associated helicase Cas3' [Paenibacillus sp. SC116]
MFLAKTKPEQTIREHTDMVVKECERIIDSYGTRIQGIDAEFWRLLLLAAIFHDIGKVYSPFQNKLLSFLKRAKITTVCVPIPHNYISIACIPWAQLKLTPNQRFLLIDAIGFHHERDEQPDEYLLRQAYSMDLHDKLVSIYEHLGLEHFQVPAKCPLKEINELQNNRKLKSVEKYRENEDLWRSHILLKGLLHRADHAASAGVEVETGVDEAIGARTLDFIRDELCKPLRDAQLFAINNADKHVVITASTGSGKTEAALLWAQNDKLFFTLPLRTSLNAMYRRVKDDKKLAFHSVGLLHSNSYDLLHEVDYAEGDSWYDLSRQYACKLTLSTIDQILKFPFYYLGYEKELATMAYSKVVIDEIQAYNPNIAAMLLYAMKLIHRMGGKFMIMTATMPKLYLDALEHELGIPPEQLAISEFPGDMIRHRIQIQELKITDLVDEMIQEATQKKVLVIVNTVNQAIEMWTLLCEAVQSMGVEICPRLLHARFTQNDRSRIENDILRFAQSGWHEYEGDHQSGIWITTQVVEASVDIDFDKLYTELSSLDSLFQRMGRCRRICAYDGVSPNIVIATVDPSGVRQSPQAVYDAEIVSRGLEYLMNYDGQLLTEQQKMDMVTNLYSRELLKDTSYLETFDKALKLFELMDMFQLAKSEAQQLLRDISTVMVIPHELWTTTVSVLVDEYESTMDIEKRRQLRRIIEKHTVSVRKSMLKNGFNKLVNHGLEHLYVLTVGSSTYESNGRGLIFEDNIWMFD